MLEGAQLPVQSEAALKDPRQPTRIYVRKTHSSPCFTTDTEPEIHFKIMIGLFNELTWMHVMKSLNKLSFVSCDHVCVSAVKCITCMCAKINKKFTYMNIHPWYFTCIHHCAHTCACALTCINIPRMIDTLWPGGAHMRHWSGSSFVQIMAFRFFAVKSKSVPMLGDFRLYPWEHT